MTEHATISINDQDLRPSLRQWLKLGLHPPEELLHGSRHSQDFNGSRAEYVFLRQRLLSWVFALLALIWIPVDGVFLSAEHFRAVLVMRLVFAGAFIFSALCRRGALDLRAARLRISAVVLIPGAFYIASLAVLGPAVDQNGLAMGYGFLPYVMLATLAVFPVTVVEGIGYALGVGLFFLAGRSAAGILFTPETLHDVWLLGLLACMTVWVQVAQIHMLLRLYREATRDPLTGLVNRRVLVRWLDVELARIEAKGAPLSVLLFDLDLFKRINDKYGHLIGDRVLRAFAEVIKRGCGYRRRLAGRYGGEEFLVILPEEDVHAARKLAERIRTGCENATVTSHEGEQVGFTTSVGVAQYRDGESAEQLLFRVDEGLYDAKEAGRNMVIAVS